MRMRQITLWTIGLAGIFAYPISRLTFSPAASAAAVVAPALPAAEEAPDEKPARQMLPTLYLDEPDTLPLMRFDLGFANALFWQETYLRRSSTPKTLGPGFSKKEMLDAVRRLRAMPFYDMAALAEEFDFYCLNSGLDCSRVRVTGYYTPVIHASRSQDAAHSVPLLSKPNDKTNSKTPLVSRGHGVDGRPLAWVKSERELANAQLQGSCLVQFPDGSREFYGFGGSVPMAGSKYVYFTKVDEQVLGAGSFPMTPGYSVAIDPKVAPLGSVIFAELPNLDAAGRLKGYSYRIVLAQDRGGAIKTARRVDVYSGIGQEALAAARKINEFGRFWVMLPKQR